MNDKNSAMYSPDILVVDDVSENLKLLMNLLMPAGYKVRPASNGAEALAAVVQKKPDLILLDIKMPGMDGFEVCKRLKADDQSKTTPIIFISALGETADKVKAFQIGGVDYITKPFQEEEVLMRVSTHVESHRMRTNLEGIVAERTLNLRMSEKDLKKHREFERLVATVSTRFVGHTGSEFEQTIQTALGDISGFFDVDAVRLYRLSPDGDVLKFRLNWLSDHLAPPQEMEMILGGTYPNIASHFMNGDPMAFGSLNECPQIPELLSILEFFGTKAGVGVPLEIDDSGVDVFAMDQVLTVHEWPEDIVERCKTIGQVLLGAVSRREVELDLEARYKDIKKLKKRLEQENIYLMEEIEIQHENDDIVGKSHLIRSVLSQAKRVAVQDTAVLVLGETGTGKGLIARDIHQKSRRRNRPLITVNCAALPATLIESELFGHEKGAFTGALNQKLGRFELADGGTMFLDEVGDLPLELQAKLLRVLEDQEFERLGSSKTKTVDVRIIAATNRNLDQLIEKGKFRADLFYRLGVFPIRVPGLTERRSDIPLLVWFFISELQHKLGKTITKISSESMSALTAYDWPGNVRELRNIIERAMILSPTSVLELGDWFPGSPASTSITSQIKKANGETLDDVQRAHILEVLEACSWKIHGEGGAAERLGLKRTTLQSRMKKLGIVKPVN